MHKKAFAVAKQDTPSIATPFARCQSSKKDETAERKAAKDAASDESVRACSPVEDPNQGHGVHYHLTNDGGGSIVKFNISVKRQIHAKNDQRTLVMQTEDNVLIKAIHEGNIEQLDDLLRNGASADQFNSVGFAAIHCAVETGNAKAVDLLLSFGADPNLLDGNEMTPLAYSAADGNSTIALNLLRHGARVNMVASAYTPLAWGAQEGHENVIRLLAEYGADMNAGNKWGISPLTNAAGEGDLRTVRLLLEMGAAINHVVNEWGG